MNNWLHSFITLFLPRCCIVCEQPLSHAEEYVCIACNIDLPRTNFHLHKDNPIEKLFWGKIPIERATAFYLYQKGSGYRRIIHFLKYKGYKQVGEVMGRYMAAEISDSSFFEGIDQIVPVPLHHKRLKKRGYNQSEWLARGLSRNTDIPVNTQAVIRSKNTHTQTDKSLFGRWENMKDAFHVQHPEQFEGKHILLVDDVLTTGSTLLACASAFSGIEGIRISIAVLGWSC